jgi:hypothetical protein
MLFTIAPPTRTTYRSTETLTGDSDTFLLLCSATASYAASQIRVLSRRAAARVYIILLYNNKKSL